MRRRDPHADAMRDRHLRDRSNAQCRTQCARGGVTVAFADGRTTFVSNEIDSTTWTRIGTANGGELVTAP